MMEPGELIERLRMSAKQSSEVSRSMAEAKSLRQAGHEPPRADLYMWPTPEQTVEGQAADALEAALLRISEQQKVLEMAKRVIADEPFFNTDPELVELCGAVSAVLSPLGG
jgi:hypothetical protein